MLIVLLIHNRRVIFMRKVRKKPLTLIEIMIVIFLIAIIGGVIGYNMRGSLDEGRAFKTREGARKVRDILLLQYAEGIDGKKIVEKPLYYLKRSNLVDRPEELIKDGWGEEYKIEFKNNDFVITSKNLHRYEKKKTPERDPEEVEEDSFNF